MKSRGRGSFIMLVVALAVIGVGYVAINSATNSIDGTSPANNLAVANVDSAYNMIGPLITVVAIVVVFGLAGYYISSPSRYLKTHKFLAKIFDFLDTTTYYFAFGLMFFAICGVVVISVYLLMTVVTFA